MKVHTFTFLIFLVFSNINLHSQESLEKGNNAYERENYAEAIEYFTAYLEEFPDTSDVHLMRGNSYFKIKEYEKAIEDYTQLIELKGNKKNYYLNRAKHYLKLKNYGFGINIGYKIML